MSLPLVSIIIPTFNRALLIGETLNSIIAQTYQNWECIIVDDGSNDNTLEVLNKFSKKDSRIVYFSCPRDRQKGGNACRNYGLELSKGTFIQFLDSDDCLSENKIESQTKLLLENNAEIAICKWVFFKINIEETISKNDLAYYRDMSSGKELLNVFGRNNLFIPSHAYLVHRSLILKAGHWNEYLTINQDAEFFTRILIEASEVLFEPLALVYYRMKIDNNVSAYSTIRRAQEVIDSWKFIELILKIRYKEEPCVYVEGAKWRYFRRIKKQYPELIKKNSEFFSLQIKKRKLHFRILNKLKRIYSKYF